MWEWDAGNLMRGSLRYTLYLSMIIKKKKKGKYFESRLLSRILH
jgi:hypothetical protein